MCAETEEAVVAISSPGPPITRRALFVASGVTLGFAAFGIEVLALTPQAIAAGSYLRPCGNVPISDTWQGHKNRNPPSGEPGTDYSVGKGTPIVAAIGGTIVDRKDSTSTATGRYLALRATDGNYIRYLHLNASAVPVGATVSRGQVIAYSGASGNGSENGYGPHVHVSLWIGGTPNQLGFKNTVDFENYIGGATPSPGENSQFEIYRRNNNMASLYYKTEGGRMFALAGDSPGTSANWLETADQNFANQLAAQHGTAALLSLGTWNLWKSQYLGQV